jgi:hypothetical protein
MMNSIEGRLMALQFALLCAAASLAAAAPAAAAQDSSPKSIRGTFTKLGLGSFNAPIVTYYSDGARERAERLARDIDRMNRFYETELGIRPQFTLAVLNSNDWKETTERNGSKGPPYGMPFYTDDPETVIFMPARGGMVADGILTGVTGVSGAARQAWEDYAEQTVDGIGFHELGYLVAKSYGIVPPARWLDELVATYLWLAYAREFPKPPGEQPHGSAVRPTNTTLEDFERLYMGVDNYPWYQGKFGERALQIVETSGLQFIKDLKKEFPLERDAATSARRIPPSTPEILARLEKFSPGFIEWAKVFSER